MSGKELKLLVSKFLKSQRNLSTEEFYTKAQIPKRTYYNLFEKTEVEEHYIQSLIDAGLEVPKSAKAGVPVYNSDFTGGDLVQYSDFQPEVIGHIDLNGYRKCVAFVRVKGNSMFPLFTAGDFIGLEPQEKTIIEYGQPFAIVTKDQKLVKIVRKGKDDEHLILRSVNKEFDDINVHKDDILTLYKARGPVRDPFY